MQVHAPLPIINFDAVLHVGGRGGLQSECPMPLAPDLNRRLLVHSPSSLRNAMVVACPLRNTPLMVLPCFQRQ